MSCVLVVFRPSDEQSGLMAARFQSIVREEMLAARAAARPPSLLRSTVYISACSYSHCDCECACRAFWHLTGSYLARSFVLIFIAEALNFGAPTLIGVCACVLCVSVSACVSDIDC